MTVKEAFAQAFDEAFVMDAAPAGLSGNSAKAGGANAAKAGGMGSGMAAAAAGAEKSMGPEKSLSEHKQEGCEAEKNGHPERCPYVQKMAKEFEKNEGLDHAAALQKAIGVHSGGGNQPQGQQPMPGQAQQPNPQMIEQQAQQIAQNPQMIDQVPSVQLPQPETVNTQAGEISVQTTVQKGIVENLSEQAAGGNTIAEQSIEELVEKYANGTITPSAPEGQPQEQVPQEGQPTEQPTGQPAEQPVEQQPQVQTITTSDGKSSRNIDAKEAAILEAEPEKKDVFQMMVDIEAMVGDLDVDSPEFKDFSDQYQALATLFYGKEYLDDFTPVQPPPPPPPLNDEGDADGGHEAAVQGRKKDYLEALDRLHETERAFHEIGQKREDFDAIDAARKEYEDAKAAVAKFEQPNVVIIDDDGNQLDTGDDRRKWGEQERVIRNAGGDEPPAPPTPPTPPGGGGGGSNPPNPPNPPPGGGGGDGPTPPNPPPNNPTNNPPNNPNPPSNGPSDNEGNEDKEEKEPPAPPDAKFRIGDNKFKVGGKVYTDVSGKGLIRTMISAFLAGLKGEGIITGWDKISGAWDEMKRSEAGENVRSGIESALANLGMDELEAKVTDPVAKAKLSAIKRMVQEAKTPAQEIRAYSELEKWKKQYLGETKTVGGFAGKLGETIGEVHKDGKVLGSNQKIDNDGNLVDETEVNKKDPPGTDILGEPGFHNADGSISWHKDPQIDNLDEKKQTISDTMSSLGIVGEEQEQSTSFNSTFIKYGISSRVTDKQKSDLAKQIAFQLGCEDKDVSVAIDNKNKQLVVGIKNDVAADVSTRDIMNTDEWKQACKTMRCPIIIGRSNDGKPVIKDIKELTHLLIAGDTGKGKSVGMNTILCSMMMAKKPNQLKTVLIDLKKMELSRYKNSKHNAMPVAVDIDAAMKSLEFVRDEMENRETLFANAGVTNIDEYNAKMKAEGKDELPTLILGIDELTELKSAGGGAVDALLKTIGDKGRASGIHMICATQKPTKENIGEVKTNFPSRLAFPIKTAEGSEAIFTKGDRRANSIGGKGEFILDVDNVETRGKGSAMGHDDPQRVVRYWGGDAEVPEGDSPSGEGPQLPQEHLDAISDAVSNGQSISMEAEDGFYDAFKGAFPEDWTITEVEVEGKKHWKASPPTESEEPEKPEEPETTEGGDNPEAAPGGEEETDWRKADNRDDAVSMLEKVREKAKADAWEKFNNSEATSANKEKLRKALAKADTDFDEDMGLVDMKYPPPDEELGGDTSEGEEGTEGSEGTPPEDENEDSPASTMKDAEAYLSAEKERIDKALAKPTLKLRERQKLRKERKALQERFNAAKAKFDAGGTSDEILDILEPQEKPEGGKAETSESESEPKAEEQSVAEQQAQAERDEKLKASVRPQKFYNSPGFKATQKVPPNQIKQMENLLPDGWEFVTDNQFKAPARTQNGVVFIHNPKNGSYGRLVIKKDAKGKDILPESAQIDVDTSHPDYEGYSKQEDGSLSVGPKAKAVKAAKDRLTKLANETKMVEEKVPSKGKAGEGQGEDKISRAETFTEALTRAINEGRTTNIPQDIIERINKGEELDFNEVTKELTRQYNNYAYGHDEAPDNMTIVANAVAEALQKIND